MSAIHEQAMTYVYQQVQQRLIGYFSRAERTALQLLIQRIVVAAGGMEYIGNYKVLVAHGGGEVSSYTLAMLRAAQLSIAGRSPTTFQLRVATLRHAGMTQRTLDTLNNGYSRLFFHDDDRVELLMVENHEVLPFNHQRPVSTQGCEAAQRNRLMVGHLSGGDICATLCNDTYLALGDFYQRVTAWDGGVHVLVSGDSASKQSQLLAWLKKAAQAGSDKVRAARPLSLDRLFARMDQWSEDFYRDLYGEHYQPRADISTGGYRPLAYIGFADLLEDIDPASAPLLTEFMAYTPDPLGFHFSHPAFANPVLMAHLRGLKAECLRELPYGEGVEEFLLLAQEQLKHVQIPQELLVQAGSDEGRAAATAYARQFFGLDESQLICLMFSPFIHHGERLESYLRQCHPGMLVALPELHKVLQGKPAAEMLQQWVTVASGLPLPLLQHLYRQRPMNLLPGSSARKHDLERDLTCDDMARQLSAR
ncbi:hypothetical protein [Pseudomonas trivialis]|uniref:Uncharacterized protein n=1 Tax=Pseudomonas trivialis TaxID=200450 RepID=A0A0R2ZDH4_9PSED|nr:hypothetical protein [Pseudomonas trivialis]KRP59232.1 hypothetical protein TU79_15570 [Pseudomonas trivialis]SDS83385.1 hypothetical protein SAMN04490205_3797 [Pseudomonas trivialis]